MSARAASAASPAFSEGELSRSTSPAAAPPAPPAAPPSSSSSSALVVVDVFVHHVRFLAPPPGGGGSLALALQFANAAPPVPPAALLPLPPLPLADDVALRLGRGAALAPLRVARGKSAAVRVPLSAAIAQARPLMLSVMLLEQAGGGGGGGAVGGAAAQAEAHFVASGALPLAELARAALLGDAPRGSAAAQFPLALVGLARAAAACEALVSVRVSRVPDALQPFFAAQAAAAAAAAGAGRDDGPRGAGADRDGDWTDDEVGLVYHRPCERFTSLTLTTPFALSVSMTLNRTTWRGAPAPPPCPPPAVPASPAPRPVSPAPPPAPAAAPAPAPPPPRRRALPRLLPGGAAT